MGDLVRLHTDERALATNELAGESGSPASLFVYAAALLATALTTQEIMGRADVADVGHQALGLVEEAIQLSLTDPQGEI